MNTLTERTQPETERFRSILNQFGADMRVTSPGIVQSFNAVKQTVTVQIAIREKINLNGVLSWKEIPILLDVPVFMPRAGEYILTFPIKPGDECLVVFGDNCMDAWYQSGGIQNQVDKRRHDLSDGYAIFGFWSQPRKITGYSTDTVQLRNESGQDYIEIDNHTVNIICGTINIKARDSINMEAQNAINIKAQMAIDIEANNKTVIENRNFILHEHVRVQTGKDNTGEVA